MNISPQLQSLLWMQLWQITLLVVVVGLVAVTTLRRRPHVAYLLWALVIVKCLTPPLWSSPTGVFSWLQASSPSLAAQADPPWNVARTPPQEHTMHLTLVPRVSDADGEVEASAGLPPARLPAPERFWSQTSRTAAVGVAVALWLVGAGLLLSLALLKFHRLSCAFTAEGCRASPELEDALQRLARRLGVRLPVRLVVSPNHDGPLVFGILRPLIVLPEIMVRAKSVSQLEPILAHELIHVRRGDTLLGALQFLAQVAWWFHPLVWWASRQVNRVCERCCDAEVIASLNCPPSVYATSLLDVLEFKSTIRPALAMPGVRPIDITKNRVSYIMKESEHFRSKPAKIYWLLAVVLAFVILPGGAWMIGKHGSGGAQLFHGPLARAVDAPAQWRRDAREAFESKDWSGAARAYAKIVDRFPNEARSWFLLGYALHADGQLDEAIKIHRKATEFPSTKVVALYNLSCAYALKGNKEKSLQHLQESLDAGFRSSDPITKDADFSGLLDDPEFLECAARAQPPSSREIYRQLDFLVGHWTVATRSGETVGKSVVTVDVKGFLLTEKWTNPEGGTGTSISFYDPADQTWKQTWVDEHGTVVRYTGVLEDGVMQMNGKRTMANGKEMLCRKRYAPRSDGTVWQVTECSDDDGLTWSISFDGVYQPNQRMTIHVETTSV